MTKLQESRFQHILEIRRTELNREIWKLRERLSIDRPSEPMDRTRSIADREWNARNVERLCGELRRVEGALLEIREGTFGVCAVCGARIPTRRLEAVPWSPYCVACQERAERPNGEDGNGVPYAIAS